jgi:hypothetical protein
LSSHLPVQVTLEARGHIRVCVCYGAEYTEKQAQDLIVRVARHRGDGFVQGQILMGKEWDPDIRREHFRGDPGDPAPLVSPKLSTSA